MRDLPDMLYYNCGAPLKILEECRVRRSILDGRDRGLSMSSWSEMGSHGPFKIAFNPSPWFKQFIQVKYGPAPFKNPMFQDEQEWFSYGDVEFQLQNVQYIMFMLNAPVGAIGPRILKNVRRSLTMKYGPRYRESVVNDPYLRKAT